MADVQIGYVGRGRYGEPVFRVSVPNGHYGDVMGEPVYRFAQNKDAPAHKLLRFADTEVEVKAGMDKTLPYDIVTVISDTKDGLNYDIVGRNEYGYPQRNPRIMTEPGEELVPDAADHSDPSVDVPDADGYLPAEEFFDRYDDVAEDFETPEIPDEIKAELEEGQRAQEQVQQVREVVIGE